MLEQELHKQVEELPLARLSLVIEPVVKPFMEFAALLISAQQQELVQA